MVANTKDFVAPF
ncbi:Protein of unknown function [Lactobacillus helveticus CIRM-BIA 953]|uniref:Uncharacterized protein n=1 Tax=Lactobacillus helveticus CIRM-BIA 953 TaxID=1226335 RepID=U4QBD5_LACHE|nr:Protein of unknown function [Lactobacillus helveticus CIRM-BIA 953]